MEIEKEELEHYKKYYELAHTESSEKKSLDIVLTVDQLVAIGDNKINRQTAEIYAFYLNRRLAMYEINNRWRLAHFLAQILHESALLSRTKENLNYNSKNRTEADSISKLMNNFSGLRLQKVPAPMGPYLYKPYKNRPSSQNYKKRATIDEVEASYQTAKAALHDPETFERYVYGGFAGRGLIQLTGEENYKHFSDFTGIDYVKHKEWVERPQDAVESALWFWAGSKRPIKRKINGKWEEVMAESHKNLNQLADKDDFEGICQVINKYDTDHIASRRARLNKAKQVLGISGALPPAKKISINKHSNGSKK